MNTETKKTKPEQEKAPFSDHVWEKYQWEVWLESKGVPLGWWKNTALEPVVVAMKMILVAVIAIGIPVLFFQCIDWYFGDTSAQVYRDAKKGSGG
jgi:hypothetical protein